MSGDTREIGATGGCLCGAVRFVVTGPLRPVIYCHCTQCRKTSGHFVAATQAADADLEITDHGTLAWYRSSEAARRGFCNRCGSNLFWKPDGRAVTSIMAGTIDGATGLESAVHIFCADKADYYEIEDGLPAHAGAAPLVA